MNSSWDLTSRDHKTDGKSSSLAIVKQIIEHHQDTIMPERAENLGGVSSNPAFASIHDMKIAPIFWHEIASANVVAFLRWQPPRDKGAMLDLSELALIALMMLSYLWMKDALLVQV